MAAVDVIIEWVVPILNVAGFGFSGLVAFRVIDDLDRPHPFFVALSVPVLVGIVALFSSETATPWLEEFVTEMPWWGQAAAGAAFGLGMQILLRGSFEPSRPTTFALVLSAAVSWMAMTAMYRQWNDLFVLCVAYLLAHAILFMTFQASRGRARARPLQ